MGKQCYDSLISHGYTKSGYYFKRAYCKQMLSLDFADAIADYRMSIVLNYSEKNLAFLNIGALYMTLHSYDSAIYYFDRCMKIDPNNVKAINNIKMARILKESK